MVGFESSVGVDGGPTRPQCVGSVRRFPTPVLSFWWVVPPVLLGVEWCLFPCFTWTLVEATTIPSGPGWWSFSVLVGDGVRDSCDQEDLDTRSLPSSDSTRKKGGYVGCRPTEDY